MRRLGAPGAGGWNGRKSPVGFVERSGGGAGGQRACRRSRVDDHYPWHALSQEFRNGDDAGERGARQRRDAGDDRGDRRALQGRSRPEPTRVAGAAFGRRRQGLAARPRAPSRRATARRARRWPRRCTSRNSRASRFSPPAGSAASIAAPRRPSTFPPTSSNSAAPGSPWSAPAPSRSSTSARRLEFLESQGVPDLRLPLRRIPRLLRALQRHQARPSLRRAA